MPSQDSFASKGEAQKSGFSHHKETPLSCTAPKLWALSLFSSSQHKLPTPTLRSWSLPIVVVSVAYVDSGYNPHAPRLVCLRSRNSSPPRAPLPRPLFHAAPPSLPCPPDPAPPPLPPLPRPLAPTLQSPNLEFGRRCAATSCPVCGRRGGVGLTTGLPPGDRSARPSRRPVQLPRPTLWIERPVAAPTPESVRITTQGQSSSCFRF